MKRLILMRHAKSDWSYAKPDHDRPLNLRGSENAPLLGNWLRRQGLQPDQAHVSTALRTRETFNLLELETACTLRPELYHASPEVMWQVLHSAFGDTVLMLAHNPGIAAFAAEMVIAPPPHAQFGRYPTCATLVAEFDIPCWNAAEPGTGRALDFVVPRELGTPADGSSG